MTHLECKQRYFKKVYDAAPIVECACGCGELTKSMDKYGRKKRFINGHNNRKYKDKNQYKREWAQRNKKARRLYKKHYMRRRKVELIQLSGGKCIACGTPYNGKNGVMFDFHHRDPTQKIFSLSSAQVNNRKWATTLEELKKCDLLCSNCHRLIHFGGW